MADYQPKYAKPGAHLRKKKKPIRWLRSALLTFFVALLLFSGYQVFSILRDTRQSNELNDTLREKVVTPITPTIAPVQDTPAPDGNKPTEDAAADPTQVVEITPPPETVPIAVDFDLLLEQNGDVVAWLYCPDTVISYPVVQGKDNQYYLRRLLDGSWNSSGSIFMDYRSEGGFSGWNTVIYGHNMKNDTMFGTLEEYREQEYYDAHPVWYLLTPGQNYKIELLGGYTTSGNATNTTGFPKTQAERDGLIAAVRQNSTFQSAAAVTDGERIITLITCAYDFDGARYVLVGVLREIL